MNSIETQGLSQYYTNPAQTERMPKQELDAEAFLQLLVAQMKYQDPLKGVDQQQFMQQVATLSSMQQQFSINEQLSTLVQNDQLSRATALIGREVAGVVDDTTVSGKVDSVSVAEGEPLLNIGSQKLPFSAVLAVK